MLVVLSGPILAAFGPRSIPRMATALPGRTKSSTSLRGRHRTADTVNMTDSRSLLGVECSSGLQDKLLGSCLGSCKSFLRRILMSQTLNPGGVSNMAVVSYTSNMLQDGICNYLALILLGISSPPGVVAMSAESWTLDPSTACLQHEGQGHQMLLHAASIPCLAAWPSANLSANALYWAAQWQTFLRFCFWAPIKLPSSPKVHMFFPCVTEQLSEMCMTLSWPCWSLLRRSQSSVLVPGTVSNDGLRFFADSSVGCSHSKGPNAASWICPLRGLHVDARIWIIISIVRLCAFFA